jgi:hypothetical protein
VKIYRATRRHIPELFGLIFKFELGHTDLKFVGYITPKFGTIVLFDIVDFQAIFHAWIAGLFMMDLVPHLMFSPSSLLDIFVKPQVKETIRTEAHKFLICSGTR